MHQLAVLGPVPLRERGYRNWIQHAVGHLARLQLGIVHSTEPRTGLHRCTAIVTRRSTSAMCAALRGNSASVDGHDDS